MICSNYNRALTKIFRKQKNLGWPTLALNTQIRAQFPGKQKQLLN